MSCNKYINFGLTTIIFLLSVSTEAVADLKSLSLLEKVVSSVRDGDLIFDLKFKDSPPIFKGPVFYPRSIQIELQNSYLKPSKRVFHSTGNKITSIFAAQYDPKTVRIRFILAEEGLDLSKQFHIDRTRQSLQIRISPSGGDALDRLIHEIAVPAEDKIETQKVSLFKTPISSKKAEPSGLKVERPNLKKSISSPTSRPPENKKVQDFDFFSFKTHHPL